MKKVLNNKIFLVLITAFICVTGTIFAKTLYDAKDINYNQNNMTNVEEALNDLYENTKIGDWELKLRVRSRLWSWRSGDGWGDSYAYGTVTVTSTNGEISTSIDGPQTGCGFVGTKNFYLFVDVVELISFELK